MYQFKSVGSGRTLRRRRAARSRTVPFAAAGEMGEGTPKNSRAKPFCMRRTS